MNKISQCSQLLAYMKNAGAITTMEAIRKLNIVRPASRIKDLKDLGYDIQTEIVWEKKRDGSTIHYAKYSLGGQA